MKIVFLGDSLTWGGYGGNFVDGVAQQLSDHEIINMGRGGATIINLLNRLDRVLEVNPDGVFVMVGGNDAISYVQPKTRPYYEQSQQIPDGTVPPDDFSRAYRDLLQQLHLNHVQAWIGLPPIEYSPLLIKTLREYNDLAAEAARALNVPVLDLMQHFLAKNDLPERPELSLQSINLIGKRTREGWNEYEAEQAAGGYTFSFDGLHFTREAANKAAKIIVDFLNAN